MVLDLKSWPYESIITMTCMAQPEVHQVAWTDTMSACYLFGSRQKGVLAHAAHKVKGEVAITAGFVPFKVPGSPVAPLSGYQPQRFSGQQAVQIAQQSEAQARQLIEQTRQEAIGHVENARQVVNATQQDAQHEVQRIVQEAQPELPVKSIPFVDCPRKTL